MNKKVRAWFLCMLIVTLINTSCEFRRVRRRVADGLGEGLGSPTATAAVIEQNVPHFRITVGEGDHPRLFLDPDDLPVVQGNAKTTHSQIWTPIREFVHSQGRTVPKTTILSRDDLATYQRYGNQLIPLAFVCMVSQETEPCDLAKTHLLTFAAWEQWGENNERNLGLAHMLLGNAIAYDWLYPRLSATERRIVRESLAKWTQEMYEASASTEMVDEWNNWWRNSYMQNHYFIANSALGIAGLVLLGEDERAEIWVGHASERMSQVQDILNQIEDGSWHEGIFYQSYELTISLPFMHNLRKITGIDILPHEYLQNYPYWRMYNYLPDDPQPFLQFGDLRTSTFEPQNVLRFIAAEYEHGHAQWLAQQLVADAGRQAAIWAVPWYVFEFLYYDPTIPPQPPTDLAKARVFPDLEAVIWRTGWNAEDLVFGLKTGPYGGRYAFEGFTQGLSPWEPSCNCRLQHGHDHADANTFYLYGAGTWLAPENATLGNSATSFHNTLLIDGQGQYRPRISEGGNRNAFIGSDGFLETTVHTTNFDYIAADATRPYQIVEGLNDFTRHVVFIRPTYFIMLDNLNATVAHDYEWVSHFDVNVTVEGNWVRGGAAGEQVLGVGIVAPRPFQTSTGDDGRPYIRIRPTSPTTDMRFVNILYPTEQRAWNTRPNTTVIADTGQAALVRVERNDGTNSIDDILITYGQTDSAVSVGPYTYDGQVGVVRRTGDGHLAQLFLYGGAFLQDEASGQALVTNLDNTHPFEVTYAGPNITVSGNIQSEVTLYAPQAENLIVNDQSQSFTQTNGYITFGDS